MQLHPKYRRIWGLLLLGALLSTSACKGCSKQDDAKTQQAQSADEPDESAPDEKAEAPEADPFDRLVFGLPIPPNAVGLTEDGNKVRVQVAMPLPEIGAFFEANFVDFEILYSHDEVNAVGLRDYMPRVYAYPYGKRSFVVYTRAQLKPEEVKKAAEQAKAQNIPTADDITNYKKGDPILERANDGRLLAPGARWGEPYTPPPGSPLDKVRYRSSFGRPYGQWMAR